MNNTGAVTFINKFYSFTHKKKILIISLMPVILMVAHLEKRPLNHEGGQSNIRNLADKVDWWGSILPIITPYKDYAAESFLVSVIALSIFLIGSILIFQNSTIKGYKLFISYILIFIGFNFVIANSRDSFVLSFATLNFGLILLYKNSRSRWVLTLIAACLPIMVSFKPLTSIAIVTLLISILLDARQVTVTKKIMLVTSISILISVFGVALDKGLAKITNLKESFPEQQPIYQDLASFYCWSEDPTTKLTALNALKPVLATSSPSDICLTLRPNSWVYLVSGGNFLDQKIDAPLISKINSKDLNWVRNGWIKTIMNDPVDYIQFKLISATQVITVGNPFKYPLLITSDSYEDSKLGLTDYELPEALSLVSMDFWKLLHKILSIIGSTYLFSITFMFLILFISLTNFKSFRLNKSSIALVFICNVFNIMLLSIGFVSDEARYVFPIVLLTYLFLSVQENKISNTV